MTTFTLPMLAEVDAERRLVVVLMQLCIIIATARVAGVLFRKIRQPAVVGEIIAGLILGPSLLGHIDQFPAVHNAWHTLFRSSIPGVSDSFDVLSQLGLIFLLFLIGLEFDFRHLRAHGKSSAMISLSGIVFPFVLGLGLAQAMFPYVAMPAEAKLGFSLFMGTAMSITAIPILGRIMMELNITRSRLGAVTITASAIDDASGWILLATISALVQSHFRLLQTIQMMGLTVAFGLFMIFLAKPLLSKWIRRTLQNNGGELSLTALAVLMIVMFLCAIATSVIGIFAIFGAFILGAVLSSEEEFRLAVANRLKDFVTAFFLPIFFTYTGLRTDVGSVGGAMMWGFAAAVSALAILGKFGGCALAARLTGFNRRESACIGVMMNTRALMELIVINVGYDLHVIPRSVFCMLVLMAVLTTVMTSPILLRLMGGTELEPLIRQSGFLLVDEMNLAT